MLLAISILLLCVALAMILKGQTVNERRTTALTVENEHRFTALETRLDSIQADIKDVKQYNWVIYSALAGLAGEAGLRILKKKQSSDQ